ncbi:hypothetical protein ACFX15_030760 [Malus domestica]
MSGFPLELIFEILLRLPLRICYDVCASPRLGLLSFMTSTSSNPIFNAPLKPTLLALFYSRNLVGRKNPLIIYSSPFYDNDTTNSKDVKIEHPLKNPEWCTLILGYANGLVCIYNYDAMRICFVEPVHSKVQDASSLPQPPSSKFTMKHHYGFGSGCVYEVSVHSLKSNSWKSIQGMSWNGFSMHLTRIVFFNGALSWLMHNKLDTQSKI